LAIPAPFGEPARRPRDRRLPADLRAEAACLLEEATAHGTISPPRRDGVPGEWALLEERFRLPFSPIGLRSAADLVVATLVGFAIVSSMAGSSSWTAA